MTTSPARSASASPPRRRRRRVEDADDMEDEALAPPREHRESIVLDAEDAIDSLESKVFQLAQDIATTEMPEEELTTKLNMIAESLEDVETSFRKERTAPYRRDGALQRWLEQMHLLLMTLHCAVRFVLLPGHLIGNLLQILEQQDEFYSVLESKLSELTDPRVKAAACRLLLATVPVNSRFIVRVLYEEEMLERMYRHEEDLQKLVMLELLYTLDCIGLMGRKRPSEDDSDIEDANDDDMEDDEFVDASDSEDEEEEEDFEDEMDDDDGEDGEDDDEYELFDGHHLDVLDYDADEMEEGDSEYGPGELEDDERGASDQDDASDASDHPGHRRARSRGFPLSARNIQFLLQLPDTAYYDVHDQYSTDEEEDDDRDEEEP
ncbi:hypothetical protein ATCC90586_005017 [Pythium insidiosum]|nr:hypothetical protein ATCC90586_005017 [Pythium insidiosum]